MPSQKAPFGYQITEMKPSLMLMAAPPAPMPMRMPPPVSFGLPMGVASCRRGAYFATISRFITKPPALSTTPRRARKARNSPSCRQSTPMMRPSSRISESARVSISTRTFVRATAAFSVAISVAPPSSQKALGLCARGAGFAACDSRKPFSLPDQVSD